MSNSLRRLTFGFLLLVISACGLSVEEIDEGALSTAVAGTLEAVGELPGIPTDADTTEAPSEGEIPHSLPTMPPTPETPGVLTVIYISGGNLWLYQEGSSPVQLTTSNNAVEVHLSTDGTRAVFTWYNPATDAYELHTVATATGVESVLLTQADLDTLVPLGGALHNIPHQMAFIPGSHRVLFSTRKTFEGPGLAPNNDLWSIDLDSGVRTAVLAPGLGGDFYLSPSGTRLALTQATSVGFANADGSGRSPDHLTFPSVITYSEYQYYPIAVWAPDESAVAVVIPPEDPFASTTARVFRLPVGGGSAHLTDLIGFGFFRNQGRTPLLSPDLSRVAFLRETAPNTFDLVVQPLDGGAETILASGDISWHGWHPDSQRVVYGSAPQNYMFTGPGLTASGLGFGRHLRWADADTFLYLDTLTATHRFSRVDLPGGPVQIDVIVGQAFDFDLTR